MSKMFLLVAATILFASLVIATPVAYINFAARPSDNSPPVANADSYTLHGNGNAGSVLVNDFDPDPGQSVSATLLTFPTYGSLGNDGNGNFWYRRNSSTWTGTDSFTYKVCDSGFPTLCSAPATVTITVVNQAPSAVGDSYSVHGNTVIGPLTVNDSDPDGDPLTLSILTSPAHGTVTGLATPPYPRDSKLYSLTTSNYTGPDSFTYKVCDTFNACSTATVALSVWNNPPTPYADYYIVAAGTSTTIGPLRINDFDPDGDTIGTPSLVVAPSNGTVTGVTDPDYKSYRPNTGFTGTDTWQYRITDNLGRSAAATVYVLVVPAGLLPPKVPYAACPSDPGCLTGFNPQSGGAATTTGGPAGNSGPSWPDPVNLATGRETFAPTPDLRVYNPTGPSVDWGAHYFADQALKPIAGYGSPGLSRGWVHNYDIRLQATAGSWGALTLHYPNGSTETLTPVLNGGLPTGGFNTVAGAPYFVTGISGSPTGTWQSVTITWKDQTKWKFTQHSGTTYALNQITNRTGQSLNFNWNSSRALTQVSDAGSSTVLLTLAHAANGRLSTAKDVYNRQVSYSFTTGSATTPAVLQTVSQVVASGTTNPPARWTYTYTSDKGQQLNTITVPSPTGTGNSTATINYSSTGKVSSLVDANGNQRAYTYNGGTTQVQVKDAANNVALSWTQKFNTSGLDTGITDAASHSTTIAYSDTNNPLKPTSVTDRNTHTTTYTYDTFGNVLSATSPRGVTTTYTWNYSNFSLGRLTSIQEGSKPSTTISYYEPSGLIQTITQPEPNNGAGTTTTTYTYDSLGNILTVVAPGNNAAGSITTTLNYITDGAYSQSAKIGQPLTITDNLNHTTHLRYDSQGRTTSITDALGNQTEFSYTLVGHLLTTTFPATGQTGNGNSHNTNSYLYVGGPLTSTTFYDENNTQVRQVDQTYGPEGESLTVTGSTEPATSAYDALYRLKTLKDGSNNTTTYVYNNVGLPSSITMPGGEVTQFTSYDNDGNLLQRIDGNNVTTDYVYNDVDSLLTDIQYPATTNLNVHFTYDSFGRRSGMTDSTGTHSYSYGNLDELLSVTTTYTGLPTKSISYSYYLNGSRESMTTPAGTFNYSYDAAGRAVSMTNPFNETTSWSYHNNNWLQTQTLHNNVTATYTANAIGRVTRLLNQIGSTTISDFSNIAYDGVGNRTSVTASVPGATSLNGTTGFTYDGKNQLTQETSTRNGDFTDNFVYDSAGNPTTFKGQTRTYNSNNQQTGTGFSYDNNGNPTTYGGTSLTFDPENRMTASGSNLTAGYNGNGLRARKQTSVGRTYFLYDSAVPVVELDNSGAAVSTNTFGATGLISRRTGSTSVFYVFDSEGSVSQRTDSSANILADYLFDAFGQRLSGLQTDPFGHRAQFGYYTDDETGLQLLTHRYYDPSRGRFLTPDPLSYAGGINLYSYVTNNPMNFSDPLGLAKLVYWGPAKDSKRGHVALLLDDGTYISYWPTCFFGKDAQPFKQCPARKADFEKDKTDEGRNPLLIQIDGLNEQAIKDWWNNGKNHGLFSLRNNCSDIVGQALNVGGMPFRTQTLYTTPDDVRFQVEQYMFYRAYPAPVPQPPPSPIPRRP